jgi:hypothetical protein
MEKPTTMLKPSGGRPVETHVNENARKATATASTASLALGANKHPPKKRLG